jgi:hypothetical protein
MFNVRSTHCLFFLVAAMNVQKFRDVSDARLKLLMQERLIFGDLNSIIIIHVLAQEYWARQTQHAKNFNLILPEISHGHPTYVHATGISGLSISDITDIPRTTVLRSLKKLGTQGFVDNTPVGYYINPDNVRLASLDIYEAWFISTLNIVK